MGRPSLAPGVYFRCLLVGFFEGIDSERGIAWRVADSMSLRHFLGLLLSESPPDHSTLSRTRRLLPLETHQEVFTWVLARLAEDGLVRGKTLGVDATTLEANAAMRSIVRRATGESYQEYLIELAKAAGIETPTRQQLARLDRKRKKRTSNDDWFNPNDPDAEITKMKDGRTHLGHKQEIAVDLDTGAVVGVTVAGGADGDTESLSETVAAAEKHLEEAAEEADDSAEIAEHFSELVADKGYHSNAVVSVLQESGVRTYIAEPDRGRRRWGGEQAVRDAIYANRRRIRAGRGKQLLRKRGELIERPFAHLLETGGMRRTHLRGHENILKRLLVHTAAFNLSLMMRKRFGVGKPRQLQGARGLVELLVALIATTLLLCRNAWLWLQANRLAFYSARFLPHGAPSHRNLPFATG
jgi:transposase